MKLQTKVWLCVMAVSIGLTGAVGGLVATLVFRTVRKTEQRQAREYASFVRSALYQKQEALSEYMYDWSAWDDLYAYAAEPNTAFASSNLNDGSLQTLKLHYLAVIDAQKRTLYERTLAASRQQGDTALPIVALLQERLFTAKTPNPQPLVGWLRLPEGVMAVVFHPILDSRHEGPVRGTLIWGRYVNEEYLQEVSQTINLPVTATPVDTVLDSEGIADRTPAHLVVFAHVPDWTGQPVLRLQVPIDRFVWRNAQNLLRVFAVGLLGMGIVLGGVLYFLTARFLVRRLQRLDKEVLAIQSSGHLQGRVPATGDDELGRLGASINVLLQTLQEREAEIVSLNAQLRSENRLMQSKLEIARQLQQALLPAPQELQAIADWDIAGYMLPAEEVGGDYYDVLVGEHGLRLAIGDVTGHGLESGIVSIMVQTALRTLHELPETDPPRLLQVLNQVLYKNIRRLGVEKSLTLTVLEADRRGLRLFGQHEEVVVVRAQGAVEFLDTSALGFPVGLVDDLRQWVQVAPLAIDSGDVVVLYSDGLTEAQNAEQIWFGLERLAAVVQQHRQEPAAAICQRVVTALQAHMGDRPLDDDVTLLVLKKQKPVEQRV